METIICDQFKNTYYWTAIVPLRKLTVVSPNYIEFTRGKI